MSECKVVLSSSLLRCGMGLMLWGLMVSCQPAESSDDICTVRLRTRAMDPASLADAGDQYHTAHVVISSGGFDVFSKEANVWDLFGSNNSEPQDVILTDSTAGEPFLGGHGQTFSLRLAVYEGTAVPPARPSAGVFGRSLPFSCVADPDRAAQDPAFSLALGSARTMDEIHTLTDPRVGSTMSHFGENRVLVFGGEAGEDGEVRNDSPGIIYDHNTGDWCDPLSECVAEPLPTHRIRHAAISLADGRVVLVGGQDPETLEPLSDVWVVSPDPTLPPAQFNLTTPRYSHVALALHERGSVPQDLRSQVLVCGGRDSSVVLGSCELIDPDAGTSSLIFGVAMETPRYEASATLLTSGEVMIAGGRNSSDELLASAEFFDTRSKIFSPLTTVCAFGGAVGIDAMCARRAGHRALVLQDDNVLIVGGVAAVAGGMTTRPMAEVYVVGLQRFRPATDGTTEEPDIQTHPRTGHSVSQLPCATAVGCPILIAGGEDPQAQGQVYSPTLYFPPEAQPSPGAASFGGRYEVLASTFEPMRQSYHAAITLNDGIVLFAGGRSSRLSSIVSEGVHSFTYCDAEEGAPYDCPEL